MIDVGELRLKATGLRRFLLFQSLPQFISWAAIVVLMYGLGAAVVHLVGAREPLGLGVLCGGLGGTLPSVWLARQASFRVRGLNEPRPGA